MRWPIRQFGDKAQPRLVAATVAVLLIAGCSSSHPAALAKRDAEQNVTTADFVPFPTFLAAMDGRDRESLLRDMAAVDARGEHPPPPSQRPPIPGGDGVLVENRAPGLPRLPLLDGAVSTHVDVIHGGRNPIHVRVLCALDARQVPCSPRAKVWDATSSTSGVGVRLAVSMRARPDQQLQILVLQDLPDTLNRHSGLLPSSFAYSFRLGPGNAKPEITGSIPPGPSINASCGTIIVARKTQPRNLTVSVSRDDPLVLGIHRCRTAKAPVAVVALLAVVDNARLVGVAPPWGGYDRITAENSYLPIPPSFTADADALQVFVVNAENVTGGDPLALEPSSNAALIDTKPS